jgi:hypothetical protein
MTCDHCNRSNATVEDVQPMDYSDKDGIVGTFAKLCVKCRHLTRTNAAWLKQERTCKAVRRIN